MSVTWAARAFTIVQADLLLSRQRPDQRQLLARRARRDWRAAEILRVPSHEELRADPEARRDLYGVLVVAQAERERVLEVGSIERCHLQHGQQVGDRGECGLPRARLLDEVIDRRHG